MHIEDVNDDKDETKVDDDDFGGGFSAADDTTETDEFTDKPADDQHAEAETKTKVEVVTEKPTETEAKKAAETTTVAPADDGLDFLSDDERTELVEAEKKHPGISKIVQRTKSWDGRLKKAHTDLRELQTELAQRETDDDVATGTREEVVEKVTEKVKTAALSEEEQNTVNELESEYPVINKAIDIKARKVAQDIVDAALEDRLQPVEESLKVRDEDASKSHFREVANSHKDFYEIATGGALDEWILDQPKREGDVLKETRDKGSASEVIALLDRFKKESGYQTTVSDTTTETKETTDTKGGNGEDKAKAKEPTKAQQKRKADLEASEAVPRRSAGPPAASPDDEDFVGGFDESSKRPDD